MTDKDIETTARELLALSEKATEGPWYGEESNETVGSFPVDVCVAATPSNQRIYSRKGGTFPVNDKRLIVGMRNHIDALCNEVIRLRAWRMEARQTIRDLLSEAKMLDRDLREIDAGERVTSSCLLNDEISNDARRLLDGSGEGE